MARKKKEEKKSDKIWISGRRKTAVASIVLSQGKGEVTVNGGPLENYFSDELAQEILFTPLKVVGGKKEDFDISIKVSGGGKKGQLEAVKLGIARALVEHNPEFQPTLRKRGFLTRDPRMKERKKYGLRRARKAPQFSKR